MSVMERLRERLRCAFESRKQRGEEWAAAAARKKLTAAAEAEERYTARKQRGLAAGAYLVHFSAQRKRFLWDRGCV